MTKALKLILMQSKKTLTCPKLSLKHSFYWQDYEHPIHLKLMLKGINDVERY